MKLKAVILNGEPFIEIKGFEGLLMQDIEIDARDSKFKAGRVHVEKNSQSQEYRSQESRRHNIDLDKDMLAIRLKFSRGLSSPQEYAESMAQNIIMREARKGR